MTKDKQGSKDEAPPKEKKAKSKFGQWLEKRSSKSKDKTPKPLSKNEQLALDKKAAEKLRVDLLAVTGLKNQLLAVGATVPKVIADALTSPAGQAKTDEALKAKDAVSTYLKGRAAVVKGRDEAGLLKFGSHPMVAKFTLALDQMQSVFAKSWENSGTADKATEYADSLVEAVKNQLESRGQAHARLDNADKEIAKAEVALEKVSGLGAIDVTEVSEQVRKARTLLTNAKESKDVPLALQAMTGWQEKLSEAKEDGGSKTLGKFEDFKKLRQAILDQIGEASLLRGASDDTPLRALLRSAQIDLDLADEQVSQSMGPDGIRSAMEILKPNKTLLARAKKIDEQLKQQVEADLKALPKYRDALAALARAREKLAGMPGTSKLIKEADITLAAAQLGTNGKPPGGYAAALKLLVGKAESLLKDAELASENLLKIQRGKFPNLAEARQRAELVLSQASSAISLAQAGVCQEALAQAIEQDDPIAALNKLIHDWTRLREDAITNEKKLITQLERMTQLTTQLENLHAPKAVLDGLRNTAPIERLRQDKEFGRAQALAERATQAAEDYLKIAEDLNGQWNKELESLAKIRIEARRWFVWPPLEKEARSIEGDAERVRQAVANGEDLQGAIEAAKRLKVRIQNLTDKAKTQNIDTDKFDPEQHGKDLKEVREKWALALTPAKQALDTLAKALQKSGAGDSATNTIWHDQLAKLEKQWELAMANPKLDPKQSPIDELNATLEMFRKEALLIQQAAAKAASNSGELSSLLDTAKGQDKEKVLRQQHARLAETIGQIERAGSKVDAYWTLLGREFDGVKAPGLEKKWQQLEEALKVVKEKRFEELTQQRVESNKKAEVLDKELNKLLSINAVKFPGYFEDLNARLRDAKAMVNVNDVTLMEAGQRQIAELTKQLEQARKGGEKEGGESLKTFNDVADMWKQLSNKVGEKVLMSRMPSTYNRLYAELKAATQKSKILPPDEGWKLLEALRVPIDNAVAQAEIVSERNLVFKARQEQLKENLTALHKLTKTWATEKTDAYNDKFNTRMASAKQMSKQEGQMDVAFTLLDDLQKELSDLMANPSTAREKLQKLDSEAAAEQRELRDLGREWERTRTFWSDVLMPQVKEALESRGEGDNTEYQDLKGAVSRAEAPLKGYLAVISKLPHEYLAANASPDMKEARSAFTSAQARLMQLQKTANRLISGGGSTNVDLEQDLRKLEDEWISRTKRLQQAFGRLAESIRTLPDQVGSDPADENTYLQPGALGQLKTAANVLGRSIPEAAKRFSESAFSSPLAVLGSKTSTPADRRTAREEALRTMRLLRDEIVNNDLFKQLFRGAQTGVFDVDVRPEIGLLQASLKKIELAVLVAV